MTAGGFSLPTHGLGRTEVETEHVNFGYSTNTEGKTQKELTDERDSQV